ncbi:MAG: DUF1801 domain-containing protein [Cytophagales bacterium]
MNKLPFQSNSDVGLVFENYPKAIRNKMLALRTLVLETAQETSGLTKLEETLKWGEPSYLTNIGSTIRMDWKPAKPDQYALYFKCTSRLVDTFKTTFKDRFSYENKRAIIFNIDDEIPKDELKACIKAALTYHKVKHLPTLGISMM